MRSHLASVYFTLQLPVRHAGQTPIPRRGSGRVGTYLGLSADLIVHSSDADQDVLGLSIAPSVHASGIRQLNHNWY